MVSEDIIWKTTFLCLWICLDIDGLFLIFEPSMDQFVSILNVMILSSRQYLDLMMRLFERSPTSLIIDHHSLEFYTLLMSLFLHFGLVRCEVDHGVFFRKWTQQVFQVLVNPFIKKNYTHSHHLIGCRK